MGATAFNPSTRRAKGYPQRSRTWTTDPKTGLSDVKCGCGVTIDGYAGDPRKWAEDLHRCTDVAYSTWGGIKT